MNIKESIQKYITEFDLEKEYAPELLESADILIRSENACRAFDRELDAYRCFDFDYARLTDAAVTVAEECGVHPYRARFIFNTGLALFALPYFERVGLGREEWYDSMMDFRWNGALCYSKSGVFGSYSDWPKRFFTADRVAFGRLQYNEFQAGVEYKSENFDLKPESFVITVHIPSDTRTAFSRENRLASYKRASRFYADRFDGGRVIFRCASWLLNPIHKRILPEGSNIRSFVDDFELVESSFKPSFDDLARIFGIWDYDGDAEALPESNSLMREYKRHLMAGGVMGSITGFRLGDK